MAKAVFKYRYRLLVYFSILVAFVVMFFVLLASRRSKGYSVGNLLNELKSCNTDIYESIKGGARLSEIAVPQIIDFTLLDSLGFVVYDSRQAETSYIEDQSTEPEIVRAMQEGEGSALRTFSEKDEYLFYAKRYGDRFLRTAIKFKTEKPMQIERDNAYMALIAILLAAFVIATVLILEKLTKPLKDLNKFVATLSSEEKDFSSVEFGNDDFGHVERKIADTFSQLEKAKLYKQQLSHNIAHELKTPVTGISAYLETILHSDDMPLEQIKKFVEKAYNQTVRLTKLIGEVSIINKLDEGSDAYVVEKVNISVCLKEVMEEIGYKLEANNIVFASHISSHLELNCCYTLVYSLFKNLIDNTIEHGGPNCTISLDAGLEQNNGEAGYKINFIYTDTGKGVPEEALTRIFERFYRVEEGRTRKTGGSGLGLAIVKNAVAYHKGTIAAYNREGGGLIFKFSLYSLD